MLKKVFGAAVLLVAAFAAVFFLTRSPAPFDPAELALAPEVSPYPGDASLTCEIASQPNSLSIVFSNETSHVIDSAAAYLATATIIGFGPHV